MQVNEVAGGDWPQRVASLCREVAAYVERGDLAKALGASLAVLVLDDKSVYTRISLEAKSAQPSLVQVIAALQALQVSDQVKAANWSEVWNLAKHVPVALVTWLDELLHLSSGQSFGVPEWVYGGDVLCVVFSNEELEALSLPRELNRLYLSRARSHRSLAPVYGQHVAPGLFQNHWDVTPHVPIRDMRERTVRVGSADECFSSACALLGSAGSLRIYLAEFQDVPSFESQWVQGTYPGAGVGWYARGLKNAGSLKQQALEHLAAAQKERADVVLFPELTITEEVQEAISDWLSSNAGVEEAGHGLELVICGSFHVGGGPDTGGRPWNRSVALNRFGDTVKIELESRRVPLQHTKLTSVDYTTVRGIYEVNEKGRETVLCATPLGLHALAICLDLAQGAEADQTPLPSLPIRWLWVPSLSPLVKEHQAKSANLCKQRTVTVACANQASADFGGEVGHIPGELLTSFVWGNYDRKSGRLQGLQVGTSALLIEAPVLER